MLTGIIWGLGLIIAIVFLLSPLINYIWFFQNILTLKYGSEANVFTRVVINCLLYFFIFLGLVLIPWIILIIFNVFWDIPTLIGTDSRSGYTWWADNIVTPAWDISKDYAEWAKDSYSSLFFWILFIVNIVLYRRIKSNY